MAAPASTDHDERIKRLERWSDAAENVLSAQAAHHEHLARQIAELTIGMNTLREELPTLISASLKQAAASPELWAAVRAGMRSEARGMMGDAGLGVMGRAWSAIKTGAVAFVGLYMAGGWPAVRAAGEAFWHSIGKN